MWLTFEPCAQNQFYATTEHKLINNEYTFQNCPQVRRQPKTVTAEAKKRSNPTTADRGSLQTPHHTLQNGDNIRLYYRNSFVCFIVVSLQSQCKTQIFSHSKCPEPQAQGSQKKMADGCSHFFSSSITILYNKTETFNIVPLWS